jgi:formylmethanofuran dehydrogenase subunit D
MLRRLADSTQSATSAHEASGEPVSGGRRVASKRFIMCAGRTNKQGQQVNVGKDKPEYEAIVNGLTMHPEDMKALGIVAAATVRVRTEFGEALFQCREGKVPRGIVFVPYGPPTCRLMGGDTDGTGMPTSKGWEVEVEPTGPGAAGS